MSEPLEVSPSKLIADATRLIAGSLGEIIPPEAQLHLLNAQRELLLAIAAIIEHNSTRTVRQPRARRRPRTSAGASAGSPRRPERVQLD